MFINFGCVSFFWHQGDSGDIACCIWNCKTDDDYSGQGGKMLDFSRGDIIAALVASFLWSFAYIAPTAVQPAGELLLVAGRYIVFGICGISVLYVDREEMKKVSLRRILFALHLGVIGYLVFYIAVSYAVTFSGGFVTAIIAGSAPIGIAAVGNILERRTPWGVLLSSVTLIFIGIYSISLTQSTGESPHYTALSMFGISLALLASATWTYFVVLNAHAQRTWVGLPTTRYWTALVAVGAGAGSLLLLPMALISTPAATFSPIIFGNLLLWILGLGFIGSWYGTYIWVRAAQRLPAALAGPLLATEAIFGAILSLIWEHRLPTSFEAFGSFLIILGVVLCLYYELRKGRLREV